MSNDASAWVQAFPRGTFSPAQRFVLLVLADLSDTEGTSFPGVPYLMDKTEMGESTIRRTLMELEQLGYLTREATFRANGSRSSNRYHLIGLTPRTPSTLPSRREKGPLSQREGVVPQREGQEEPSIDPSSSEEEELPAKTKKRASRIPDDFVLTQEMVEWGKTQTPGVNAEYETAQFVDYWRAKAGKDATKLDWRLTWQTWMRRAHRDLPAQQQARAASATPAPPRRKFGTDPDAWKNA